MSVTIRDCFNVPSLACGEVVAGKAGLDNIVGSISVLEWIDVTSFKSDFFLQNEIVITSFYSLRDDIEGQIEAVRKMHASGEVALILFYVGIILPHIDESLIAVADELDFPLLVLQANMGSPRYSDVIMDVSRLIYDNQRSETDFVSTVMGQISLLPIQFHNLKSILYILSEKMQISLALTAHDYLSHIISPWPQLPDIEAQIKSLLMQHVTGTYDEKAEYCIHESVALKTSRWKNESLLFIAPPNENVSKMLVQQAIQVIELTCKMWNIHEADSVQFDLITSILNDDEERAKNIAKTMKIELKEIIQMWIFFMDEKKSSSKFGYSTGLGSLFETVSTKLKNLSGNYSMAVVENNLIVLLHDKTKYTSNEAFLCYLDDIVSGDEKKIKMVVALRNIDNLKVIRSFFFLAKDYYTKIMKVFPFKKIVFETEVDITQTCYEYIVLQGKDKIDRKMALLQKLIAEDLVSKIDLVRTISTYMIDAENNADKAADILHVHKNTLKYRLDRTKEILGYNPFKFPEAVSIYEALVLLRLCDGDID